MTPQLPPDLKDRITRTVQTNLPVAKDFARQFMDLMGPIWHELRDMLAQFTQKLAAAGPTNSISSQFRHLCFVGLNKVEMLLAGENQSIFGDSWQDLVNDSLKRHLALAFFAPRGLDGQPVDPYLFLTGEGTTESTMADPGAVALAQQAIGPTAMLDLCRTSPAAPNTVNMLLVADTLFHWDVKDNYVLPTSPTGWVRDVEQILKSYPRTTKAHLYTQWDTELLPPSDRLTVHRLREFPLDPATWLNEPTIQEKYGTHMLAIGILVAIVTYAGLAWQQRQLTNLTDKLNVVEQQIPRGGEFSDLERAISEQERMFAKRQLFPLVTKDTARAIQYSNMSIKSFEDKVADTQNPPVSYVVTIDAIPGVYQGWLQEEPIARAIVLNSALLEAIRKPPSTGNDFELEGLVSANTLARQYRNYLQTATPRAAVSPTAPKAKGEGK